ncbi:MAG: AraC family transcriptional regulator ligand-binding domain-containing protein [Gammaproteobacteria bacterium]|uniref:AraC family transcriptional regulator n=1 Tax=Bradyrhizobium sp. TaxID=376 RepID=UPI003D0DE166
MGIENAVLISGSLIGARELLAELGADADAVAREAGLPGRVFEDPELFVQARRIVDYLELAAAACRRADFGLLHARRLPLGMLGAGWMIMRAANTIEEALTDFVRLYGLYTDAGSLRAERAGDGLWLESSFLPVGRFGSTQAVNLTLACICLFVRENGRPAWQPRRVELRHVPDDPAPFVEFFGQGVGFGRERDAIFIDQPALSARMGQGAERRAVHEAMLRQTAGRGVAVAAQVKALLSTLVRHNACTIDSIGEALAISPRTLQRRLTAAGTSFRVLVDEVRADLAWRHVKRSELSLGRIAELLGYRSPAAFSRAFHRWHRVSPRAARRR